MDHSWYTFNYTDHFVKLLLFAITCALITYSHLR